MFIKIALYAIFLIETHVKFEISKSFYDVEIIVYYQIISCFKIIKIVTIYSSIKNMKYIFEGEYMSTSVGAYVVTFQQHVLIGIHWYLTTFVYYRKCQVKKFYILIYYYGKNETQ
jgi:hypothetical protein